MSDSRNGSGSGSAVSSSPSPTAKISFNIPDSITDALTSPRPRARTLGNVINGSSLPTTSKYYKTDVLHFLT